MREVASRFIVIGVGLALCGSPSRSEPGAWGTGSYLGISGTLAYLLSVDDSATPVGTEVEAGASGGLDLYGGYRWGRWLSSEAEFEWLRHDFTVSENSVASTSQGDSYSVSAGGRLHLARWGNGELFLSSGVGFMLFDPGEENAALPGDEIAFVARVGAGVDVYVDEEIGLRFTTTFVKPTGGLEDLDYVGVQIGFFFRQK